MEKDPHLRGGVCEVPVTHKDLLAHMVFILQRNLYVPLVFPFFVFCRAEALVVTLSSARLW